MFHFHRTADLKEYSPTHFLFFDKVREGGREGGRKGVSE